MSSVSQTFGHFPGDILLDVFEYYSPLQDNFKQRHATLTLLRSVCSHWDAVITSNRLFWSSVHIQFPTQVVPPTLIRTWLKRSGDASLDIFIIDKPPSCWTQTEMKIRHDLMLAIMPHIYRCRCLRLDVSVGFLPGFQSLRMLDAHRLEHFEVNLRGTTDDHAHITAFQQLTSLASLSALSWRSHSPFIIKWLLQFTTSCWLGQLTDLEIRSPVTAEEVFHLLTHCKSSTRITINNVRADITVPLIPSRSQMTTLPNLHFLDISLSSTAYRGLLQYFSLPNLRTLKVCGIDMSDLADTIPLCFRSLEVLRAKLWTPKDIIDEICTFLHHPDILRLPILGIESLECEGWTEYDGWNELYEQPLRQAVHDFNKSNACLRMIRCDIFSDWRRGYIIGWVDAPLDD